MKNEDELYNEIRAFMVKCVNGGIETIYLPLGELQLMGRRHNCLIVKGDTLTLNYTSGQKIKLVEDDENDRAR